MSRILFDFFAQLFDYGAKVFRFSGVIGPPNSLQNLLMCKRLSFFHYEGSQDVELLGAQMDALTTNIHDSS